MQTENARQLQAILEEHGWPSLSLVGEDGAEAAWLVAQHSISLPEFQRTCLRLLRDAVEHGDAPRKHLAYLTDRIRFNERRPQIYGTIFDWDEQGELSPWRIEDPEVVEDLRSGTDLPPLKESIARIRREAEKEGTRPPVDYDRRQREAEAWAARVGWLRSASAADSWPSQLRGD